MFTQWNSLGRKGKVAKWDNALVKVTKWDNALVKVKQDAKTFHSRWKSRLRFCKKRRLRHFTKTSKTRHDSNNNNFSYA